MRIHTRKRAVAVAMSAVLLVGGAGVAYAYWTAGGSGSGTAATGTNVAISAVQSSSMTLMAPGDSAQTLSGTFTNTNAGPVHVTSVTASISSVVQDGGAVGTCDATDYTLSTPVMNVNGEIPAGLGQGAWTGATIQFNNKAGVNQDGCKLATVHLAYAIL